jgi:polysaccharide biosynthesis transport protein
MDLSAYLTILRRWSLTLLASAFVAAAAAFLVVSRVPPTYEAEAEVLVGPINTDQNTLRAAQELVQTYAQLVLTAPVLDGVIEDLGLGVDTQVLREVTTATPDSTTRILTIRTQAADPETAAVTSNALASALEELASAGTIVRPEGAITFTNPARANPEPVEPKVSIIVLLAGAAGLVAALALVLLIDYFGNTIGSREDLSNLSQAPFLGAVPAVRGFRPGPAAPLVVEGRPNSRAALAYRLMGTQITAGDPTSGFRSIVVLGAEGREGSGEVAANIAAVLTRAGLRVRLVDCNDEEREVTRLFGITAPYGLGELALGGPESLERLHHMRTPGMDVIPHVLGTDQRIVEHHRARLVLERLLVDVEIVILSTAPLQRSASALLWARVADAAILVARRDKTRRENITFTVESLRLVGTRLLGTVLHGGRSRGPSELPDPENLAGNVADRGAMPVRRPAPAKAVEPRPEANPAQRGGAAE